MRNIFPFVLIVISILLFFFVIDPQYQKVKELRIAGNQLDQALNDSTEAKTKKDELYKADSLLRANTDNEDKLGKLLPRRIEGIKFISTVNNIASIHGLTIKNIHVDQSTPSVSTGKRGGESVTDAALYRSTSFGFSVSATYPQFKSFLSDLEKSLTIMDLNSVTFVVTDSNVYDIALMGSMYSVE